MQQSPTCTRQMYSSFISLLIFSSIVAAAAAVDPAQQDFLEAHNRARAEVGVGPLVWSNDVANYALQYAGKRAGDCKLQHSGGPYGENLAGSSGELSAADAVGLWVGEKSDYDHSSNSCVNGRECGHYTQVVWRDSTRLGCAKMRCNSGGMFVICNYDPPGNYVGRRPY